MPKAFKNDWYNPDGWGEKIEHTNVTKKTELITQLSVKM